LKLNEYSECINACDKALEIDSKNEKALFRRAQSQLAVSNHDEAIRGFQEVLKLNPSNTAAEQSIQTCRKQIKAYQQKEKQLYANIFDKMAKQDEKAEQVETTNGEEINNNNEETPATTTENE
jgi:FK506-binding protein 4/5